MNRTTRGDPQAHRIELDGDYDLTRKDEVRLLFAGLAADGRATIDLSRVTYVDSSFLRELMRLHSRLKGQVISLVGVSIAVRRILGIVKFDVLFRIVDS